MYTCICKKCTFSEDLEISIFRMYPITWATSRITQEDMEVSGHHIPANVSLLEMIYDFNVYQTDAKYNHRNY